MFGIAIIVFTGICFLIGDYRNSRHDDRLRNRGLNNNKLFFHKADGTKQKYWIDRKGAMRLEDSNRHVSIHTDIESGDAVVIDVKNRNVLTNLTQNARNRYEKKHREIAIKNGRTVYPIEENKHIGDIIKGRRFRDINTGEIYVIRRIFGTDWYMRVSDGIFIKTVWDERYDTKKVFHTGETIEDINNKQRKKRKDNCWRSESYDASQFPIHKFRNFGEAWSHYYE